ncbi:hypothetical protein FHL15_010152 [Xylaria flabelliformis]|uniref:UBX domain-containing protein 2 n=1 Tax=Xylaria flabelliformis TaxID=2512241 RepID=A0A553HLT5_9PEZI|nr:hypothetical protein FHL15_010152 [Xylaria flabelliformis]
MFFEGNLQEGISTALQQSKQVVCFVTDDGSESQQWENEFLADDSIRPGLESQSVILKLTTGSEEAGYLEALFPVPKKPTVVIIQNGQLKEYIAAGTSKEEFIRRIGKTSQQGSTQKQPSTTPSTIPAVNPSQDRQTSTASHNDDSLYDDVQPTTTAILASSSTQPTTGTTTEEKRLTAAEKQKGKARAEAEEEAKRRVDERCDPPTSAEQAHANEVKLRKQQANEERKRILKRIEDDKRARKERDAAERRARSLLSADAATAAAEDGSSVADPAIALRHRLPKAGQGDSCNLQVRLMDGSTIRSRFASDKTLGTDVRQWIDTERTDGDAPYSFRVVLTPQPNKVIEPQEEIKSLLSLGLAPSATLVLIPTRYSVAYAGRRGGGGILSPVIGVFSSLFGAIMASIGGFFALFFGGGGGNSSGHEDIPMENLRARRRDNQLYNGNSLNFEPRGEDDDEDTR